LEIAARLGLSAAVDNTRFEPLRPRYFVPGSMPELPRGRRWTVYHNTKHEARLVPRHCL